jgi:hypothetical protein
MAVIEGKHGVAPIAFRHSREVFRSIIKAVSGAGSPSSFKRDKWFFLGFAIREVVGAPARNLLLAVGP